MTISGIILLMGGFLAGLLSCKYKITDFDSTITKIRSAVSWVIARFSQPKEEKEIKNDKESEGTKSES
jgi:hypothetical protein